MADLCEECRYEYIHCIDPDHCGRSRFLSDEVKGFPELQAYIEGKCPSIGTPTSKRLSATGENYHEFSCAFPSKNMVLDAMKAAFDAYASERSGALYWRITPEFDVDNNDKAYPPRYRSYMRLLISDKPEVAAQ